MQRAISPISIEDAPQRVQQVVLRHVAPSPPLPLPPGATWWGNSVDNSVGNSVKSAWCHGWSSDTLAGRAAPTGGLACPALVEATAQQPRACDFHRSQP